MQLSLKALPRVCLEGLGKATKSVPRDNRRRLVPMNFHIKKHEFHMYTHCITTAGARYAVFVMVCRRPLRKHETSRELTWLVANVKVSVLSPECYLLATCLRPLHRQHERSSDEVVSYTLRQLSCRIKVPDVHWMGEWVSPGDKSRFDMTLKGPRYHFCNIYLYSN